MSPTITIDSFPSNDHGLLVVVPRVTLQRVQCVAGRNRFLYHVPGTKYVFVVNGDVRRC